MLIIRGVEVTQAIQYYRADQHLTDPATRGPDNSLRLVANKPAWVRVYVESDTGADIDNVSGELNVYGVACQQGGPPLTLTPQPPGSVKAQAAPDYKTTRGSIAMTLNFIIPADQMIGSLVLVADVASVAPAFQATHTLFVDVSLRQTLKLRGVMIGYVGPDLANPTQTLTLPAPGLADLQSTAAMTLLEMPIQSPGVYEVASTKVWNWPLTVTPGATPTWTDLNTAIAQVRIADGAPPGYIYYGLMPPNMPNLTQYLGWATAAASSMAGDGDALLHEVGHACGRSHAPCGNPAGPDPNYPNYQPYPMGSIGEYGLYVSVGAIPTPGATSDYMSYCWPSWISPYGHNALLNIDILNPEWVGCSPPWWIYFADLNPRWWLPHFTELWWLHHNPDPPYVVGLGSSRGRPVMQRMIAILGTLRADASVDVTHVSRCEVMNAAPEGRMTEMTVALVDPKGGVLASAPIFVSSGQAGGCGCEDGAGSPYPSQIEAYVPDVDTGAGLEIRRLDQVVWRRSATSGPLSVSAPEIRVQEDGMLDISWSALWPQAAPQHDTWVRVSSDQGRTWRAVATDLNESRATIDPAHLPSGEMLLQVSVHDGFRSSASPATRFVNAERPPIPAILHPRPKLPLQAGATLHLHGSVAVQPGSDWRGFRYAWTVDGKPAGDGLQLFTILPGAGEHTCTLSVLDAGGNVLKSVETDFMCIQGRSS